MIDDITNGIEMAQSNATLILQCSVAQYNDFIWARCVRISNVLFLLSIFRPLRDNKVIEVFSATRKKVIESFLQL